MAWISQGWRGRAGVSRRRQSWSGAYAPRRRSPRCRAMRGAGPGRILHGQDLSHAILDRGGGRRVVAIEALRALAPPSLGPRSQAITPPAPHAASPLERGHSFRHHPAAPDRPAPRSRTSSGGSSRTCASPTRGRTPAPPRPSRAPLRPDRVGSSAWNGQPRLPAAAPRLTVMSAPAR